MNAVLTAMGTMVLIAAAGWVLVFFRILGAESARVLAKIVFTLSTPSLLITTIGSANLSVLLSRSAASTWIATAIVAAGAAFVFRVVLHQSRAQATVGTLASSYLNAGNLGVPVAVYVLGDALPVVPVMLLQLLIFAPVAFAIADTASARGLAAVVKALRSPLTIGALIGLILAITGWSMPAIIDQPLQALAATAAPLALLTVGMALAPSRAQPGQEQAAPPQHRLSVAIAAATRAVIHPLITFVVVVALDVPTSERLAVVLMACLPTAQNVLVYAMQFRTGERLARDAQVITTFVSIPVMIAAVALVG